MVDFELDKPDGMLQTHRCVGDGGGLLSYLTYISCCVSSLLLPSVHFFQYTVHLQAPCTNFDRVVLSQIRQCRRALIRNDVTVILAADTLADIIQPPTSPLKPQSTTVTTTICHPQEPNDVKTAVC